MKIVAESERKRKREKSLSRFLDSWKRRLELESAEAALCKCANFLFKYFCKLTKQQKQSETIKNRLWLWLNVVWESRKLTQYTRIESFLAPSIQNKRKNVRVSLQLAQADLIIHLARNWSIFFDPEKKIPFSLAQRIKLHISALVLNPCFIPRHRCGKSARDSSNSHHLIKQRDGSHARSQDVDPRRYMSSVWRKLF